MDFLWRLFDTSDFPPRWYCGNWGYIEGNIFIISELLIWIAYWVIPFILLKSNYKRTNSYKNDNQVINLFSAFIFFCGTGHLLDVIMFFWPAYRFLAVWHTLTACISIITAVLLTSIVSGVFQRFDQLKELQEIKTINKNIRKMIIQYENEIKSLESKME